MQWSRVIDATLRHIHKFNKGEDNDVDSGLSHLAHARCNLAFLLDYTQNHPELDDRYKPSAELPEWVQDVLNTRPEPEPSCVCEGIGPCQCA